VPAHLTLVDLFAGIGGFSLGFFKSNEKNDFHYHIKLLVHRPLSS
jgi:site-specific DNA-cytosine methylase